MSFENQAENIQFPNIARELREMVAVDQDMRARSQAGDPWDETVDAAHAERLKEIIAEIGWPTAAKVGHEGAHNAWLLVQHADHDPSFQAHCLEMMKEDRSSNVDEIDVAFLEDRVRVNQGRGQLYGTQFTQEDGTHIPRAIEDEANVDARRAEIGLGPMSEQIQDMDTQYPLDGEH